MGVSPALTEGNLTAGNVPIDYGTIYVSPSDRVTRVSSVTFVNIGTGSHWVRLFVKHGGRYELARATLNDTGWKKEALLNELDLAPGDELVAIADSPNAVSYVVSGIIQR